MNYSATDTLNIGIVGTGFAAKRRAEAFSEDERSHLFAVAGHTLEHAQDFCQTHSGKPLDSWQQLTEEPEIDLVVVCTINRDHGAVVRAALEAGKHVIVEYPLALDAQEGADLVNLAKKAGKLLHVEHIELLGGLHRGIREHLPRIGTVFYTRYATINPQHPASRRWTYHREMFGFPFCAALSRVHRLTNLFGTVESVSCHSRFWDAPESGYFIACLSNAQLRFTDGTIAELVYGKGETCWQSDRTFALHGDRGTLIFERDQGTLIRGEDKTAIEVGGHRGLFTQDTKAVLDHLFSGKALYVSLSDSLYALKVADAARESAEQGKTVAINQD